MATHGVRNITLTPCVRKTKHFELLPFASNFSQVLLIEEIAKTCNLLHQTNSKNNMQLDVCYFLSCGVITGLLSNATSC